MQTNSVGAISAGPYQAGLWSLEVSHVNYRYNGEGTDVEVTRGRIQSTLPLLESVTEGKSVSSLGARCGSMADLRYAMVHSLHKPHTDYGRLSTGQIMRDANSHGASEYSQETLARLLAMQLIGAGFNPRHCGSHPRVPDPAQPVVGASGGFKGHGLLKALMSGPSTRVAAVEKLTRFMEEVRSLAREYLAAHERGYGHVDQMESSDQLVHRVRLMLLAAEPESMRLQPAAVGRVLDKLDQFEQRISAARELKAEILETRRLTQNRLF